MKGVAGSGLSFCSEIYAEICQLQQHFSRNTPQLRVTTQIVQLRVTIQLVQLRVTTQLVQLRGETQLVQLQHSSVKKQYSFQLRRKSGLS